MRDILPALQQWWHDGVTVGLATVVGVRRSAPRQPGAAMAVAGDEAVGSVSGGCVEGAVYILSQQVAASGVPEKVSYGISDDQAFAVGLTCGGEIDLFVEPFDRERVPFFDELARAIGGEAPAALATIVDGPPGEVRVGAKILVTPATPDAGPQAEPTSGVRGTLGSEGLDVAVIADARGMLEQGLTGTRHYGSHGQRRLDDVEVFIESFAPRPRMLVFGAIDFAAAVARIGTFLGYRVTVCDAREVFATPRRFPEADEVIVEWPHRYLQRTSVDRRTVICVLTHDPKFDVPLLEVALATDAGYIGAMGSRRTHDDRLARLREAGISEAQIARLSSPIGLDLGARTAEETAVSVAAELIQQRWGGTGKPLSAVDGVIHGAPPARGAAARP